MLQPKLSCNELYVKKFGGTSVGSIERIEVIAERIAQAYFAGEQQVIVLSAMAGETNRLFALASQIDGNAQPRELDMLVSTGEQISIALMSMALQKRGVKAKSLTGAQVKIHTNSQFGRASIEQVDSDYLNALLSQNVIPVIAGFQGQDAQGEITTLGRGGSDTTAVALAAALNATECQIFTDVCGVFTTDPNIEPDATKLDTISFDVMLTMAKLGAKVLHPDSVSYAQRYNVPLRVLSSFEPGRGTLIQLHREPQSTPKVVGLAISKQLALVSIVYTNTQQDVMSELLHSMQQLNVDVDFVVKSQHELQTVSFTLDLSMLERVLFELDALTTRLQLGEIHVERELARLSLVANGELSMTDVATSVFDILGQQEIHVKLLSTSDIKLSIVIDEMDLHSAVRGLHQAFKLSKV